MTPSILKPNASHLLLRKMAIKPPTINTANPIKSKPPKTVKSVFATNAYIVKATTTPAVKETAIKVIVALAELAIKDIKQASAIVKIPSSIKFIGTLLATVV